MAVTRYAFDVILDQADQEVEMRVEVRAGDRLKAELEAVKQKVPDPKLYPQHITALWLFFALIRTGHVNVGFQEFKRDVLVEYGRAAGEDVEPDPTPPADPSASPSSALTTTEEAPTTGSDSTTTDS